MLPKDNPTMNSDRLPATSSFKLIILFLHNADSNCMVCPVQICAFYSSKHVLVYFICYLISTSQLLTVEHSWLIDDSQGTNMRFLKKLYPAGNRANSSKQRDSPAGSFV